MFTGEGGPSGRASPSRAWADPHEEGGRGPQGGGTGRGRAPGSVRTPARPVGRASERVPPAVPSDLAAPHTEQMAVHSHVAPAPYDTPVTPPAHPRSLRLRSGTLRVQFKRLSQTPQTEEPEENYEDAQPPSLVSKINPLPEVL